VQNGFLQVEALLRELKVGVPPGIHARVSPAKTGGRRRRYRWIPRRPSASPQERIEVQRLAIFEHQGSLQFVGQFTDIARPAIAQETPASRLGNGPDRQTMAQRDALHEGGRQREEIGSPISQRRNRQTEEIQSMEKVGTEASLGDELAKALIGGRYDTDIHGDILRTAHPTNAVVFQNRQQLGLDGEREAAELIEKQRAAMGCLEKSDASAAGIGEGPLLVAEEFRLGQVLRDCRAIDLHPRPLSPRTFAVDPPGQ